MISYRVKCGSAECVHTNVRNVFFWRNGSEVDVVVMDKKELYGFEVKWGEKAEFNSKIPNNFKKLFLITKKEYSKNPTKIPLAVFLCLLAV